MEGILRKKVLKGTGFLVGRQLIINVINFLGNLILARILLPEDFGTYALIMFLMTFFVLIGDSGLGAVIIREPGKLSDEFIATIFTFQQILMFVISLILLIVTLFLEPQLKKPEVIWLFRVSIVSFFLLSFRMVQVQLLERDLLFDKITFLEIMETLAFQGTAVSLAFAGFGVWSMVLGLLAKNVVMLVIVFFISGWKIRYRFDFDKIKTILPFGLSFQGSHFVNFIKDSTVPIWIGSVLGVKSLGYLTWANSLAIYPIMLSNLLSRILFPFFSRIQDDKEKFGNALEIITRINILVIMAIAAMLFALAKPITIILYTEKWLPALNLLYLLVFVNFLLGSVVPFINAFNAKGKAVYTLKLSIAWAVGFWIFSLILVPKYDITGYGIAVLLTYLINVKCMYDAKKEFNIRILRNILPSLISFIVTVAAVYFLTAKVSVDNLIILIVFLFITLIIYLTVNFLINGRQYYSDIKFILNR
ncbi:MAG: oligosaccharide flippase family protein [Candidatus Goldbacteria bacterium]|nr:oligosaccharide flippase family protein [Candidatus Goldiibacteriota bacterium]